MSRTFHAIQSIISLGLPWWLSGKEATCSEGDADEGSISGSGRSLGEGNGNPFQYSCLEKPVEGGAWWATVHGIAESDMTERQTTTTNKLKVRM